MQEEFSFRKGTIEDKEAISALIKQNYNVKTLQDAKDFFERDLSTGTRYIVCEQEKKIVGFVTWREYDRPYHELAELQAIAIDDSLKGKGLAKKIFNELVKEINAFYAKYGFSLRKLYLMTHATNARAIRFYEKMGFKKEIAIPNHYYNGVDELVMAIYFK
jgi:putative acetyltransferase